MQMHSMKTGLLQGLAMAVGALAPIYIISIHLPYLQIHPPGARVPCVVPKSLSGLNWHRVAGPGALTSTSRGLSMAMFSSCVCAGILHGGTMGLWSCRSNLGCRQRYPYLERRESVAKFSREIREQLGELVSSLQL